MGRPGLARSTIKLMVLICLVLANSLRPGFALTQMGGLTGQAQIDRESKITLRKTSSRETIGAMLNRGRDAGRGPNGPSEIADSITLFLCGDVMTGRGIDQILPHPSNPDIYEPCMTSARGYVELAERANGPIPGPVDFGYIWGDALEELARARPDLRIINLETAVTKSDDHWKGKGIHYRMNPENIPCLTAAEIDFCALANNHVLDWGCSGLSETLATLRRTNIRSAGAGRNLVEAQRPAVMEVKGKGRVIVFSFGSETSGIPASWAAAAERPGVNLLTDLSGKTVESIRARVLSVKKQGDIVVASIHWGSNWGYDIPGQEAEFAHQLIDAAGVDLVHGHSSHHVRGIQIYREKLILYGCGDFINDYEGIGGYEEYRGDLGLMYFASLDPSTGRLVSLTMRPTKIERLRVNRASRAEALWLRAILNREGKKLGTRVEWRKDNSLKLGWD